MRLSISQTFGQIALQQVPPRFDIRYPPSGFKLEQIPPRVVIKSEPVRVEIDMKGPYGDMGLRAPDELARRQAKAGWEKSLKGIARQAEVGDRLARVEDSTDVFVQLGREAAGRIPEVNVGVVPKRRPVITFHASLSIDALMGEVKVEAPPVQPDIAFVPGKVQVYVEPKPHMDIEVAGSTVDITA